ncbi:hypothetical protein [Embleya sp. NPDC005971]
MSRLVTAQRIAPPGLPAAPGFISQLVVTGVGGWGAGPRGR